jgi:hypothetical protein
MTVHHRISHVERREAGDWRGAADSLATRVRTDGAGIELRLVRLDDQAAIVMLQGDDRDALARAWAGVVAPWIDASGLVLVESVFEGDEVVCARGAGDDGTASIDPVEDFVRAVVGSAIVWGLYGKTWARSAAAGDTEALPVWGDAVAAARCTIGAWEGFVPRAIALTDFCAQWLTGMDEDGIVAVVSPDASDHEANDRGTIVAPAELLARLAPRA